jgi:signal transduction histidine kinase
MLEEAGRLNRLVESLLMIARADAGQIPLRKEPLNLLEFARESCALLGVLAEEKGQSLVVEGSSELLVNADRTILRQVLINLLDNAIKYSPAGTPIRVRVKRAENAAWIEVEDRGPGIALEHQDRVFDRFYRVDEGRAREDGGTGLGLAAAKWGAEAHGGRLELDQTGATGCIFRLVLARNSSSSSSGPGV